jgi:hypothetical protein
MNVYKFKLNEAQIKNDKDEEERLVNAMRKQMDDNCIGWRDIVKREMAKHKNGSSEEKEPEKKEEFPAELSIDLVSPEKDETKRVIDIEDVMSDDDLGLGNANTSKRVSSIEEVVSDDDLSLEDVIDTTPREKLDFISTYSANTWTNQKKQLKAYMGQIAGLIERAVEKIDEMEQ